MQLSVYQTICCKVSLYVTISKSLACLSILYTYFIQPGLCKFLTNGPQRRESLRSPDVSKQKPPHWAPGPTLCSFLVNPSNHSNSGLPAISSGNTWEWKWCFQLFSARTFHVGGSNCVPPNMSQLHPREGRAIKAVCCYPSDELTETRLTPVILSNAVSVERYTQFSEDCLFRGVKQ